MPDLRLISADFLKLRRRRGMLALTLLGTLGIVALVFTVTTIQHATNPAEYGPAGGLETYRDAIGVVSLLALVAGVIVGGTAGTQDIESGVFRDLAATGRSRTALFLSRAAGAVAVVLPIVGLTAIAAAAGSIALKSGLPGPDAGVLLRGTAQVLAAGALSTAVAVGVATVVGSRGPVIGLLLAFFLAISPLLPGIAFLGDFRQLVPDVALNRIGDLGAPAGMHVALGTAIAVVLGWIGLSLAAGAWRTKTREI
jgi:ABC-type transport system involved in multi-copper enzyme maturation permease subunit